MDLLAAFPVSFIRCCTTSLLILVALYCQAQRIDISSLEAEQRYRDSIIVENPEITKDQLRQIMLAYHHRQSNPYGLDYKKSNTNTKVGQHSLQLQSQGDISNLKVLNNNSTSSEGQVPDTVEYAALVALYHATGGDQWVPER